MENIKVSIICNAYNHGPYIRDALEGFVKQRTNFEYEVLIHDDASTDNTADVIREYEKKYPYIIKPIYQTENQYSKGVNITQVYHLPRMNGKYVALCEGDDYWTDPLKLQKQYNAMENHTDVDICAHAVTKIRATNKKKAGFVAPSKVEEIFTTGEVIAGGGGFVSTNSLFYRRELLENQPEFRRCCPLDYALQIQGALRGGMLYLPDNMAVYRVLVPGSWTSRLSKDTAVNRQALKIEKMLDMVNQETDGAYTDVIRHAKLDVEFGCMESCGNYKALRQGKLLELYQEKSFQWKAKACLKEWFPWLLRIYRN